MEFVIIIFSGLIAICVGLMWRAKLREASEYNGGFCTECPDSPMVSFDMDSQGGRGYRCDQCYRRIWISYGVDQ